jgi:hypothetical protein
MDVAFKLINGFMSILFSDKNSHHRKDGVFKYCPVKTDAKGTRYFTFLFRRYNYDPESESFVPGLYKVGDKLGDFVSAKTGLTSEQVQERISIVGIKAIEMEEPSFLKVLINEFSKAFYTYQLFMIWSWFPLYYYYMALVWSVVILTSALTVSFFQYRNLRNLFRITHAEGQALVLQDGDFVSVDRSKLVPGDVIKLYPELCIRGAGSHLHVYSILHYHGAGQALLHLACQLRQ